MKMKRTANLKIKFMWDGTRNVIEIQIINGSDSQVRIFKLIFVYMHHLIKSMR